MKTARLLSSGALALSLLAGSVTAAVSPDEAAKLGSGETRLLLAVLEDAIVCYLRGPQPGEPPYSNPGSEARRWVETRGDRGLFSYESICGLLNIDAQRLRKLLRQTISKSRTPGRLAVRPKATPFISGPKSRAA